MRTVKSSPSSAAGRVVVASVLACACSRSSCSFLGLAAVFVGSYVLTCIINGATPEEVLDVLAAMPSRVESFVRSVMAM